MDAAELRSTLIYDPETGAFRRPGRDRNLGWRDRDGYRVLQIGKCKFFAHRLAWLYVHGAWPVEIDHCNGDRSDNRIANLREATRSQNLANTRLLPSNKSGMKGVSFSKRSKRWHATITVNGRQRHLGYHDSAEEAYLAYCAAAAEAFGQFFRAA